MIEWASISTEETYVTQENGQIDDPRPETKAKFAEYFSQTGMRAFYAPSADRRSGQAWRARLRKQRSRFSNDSTF